MRYNFNETHRERMLQMRIQELENFNSVLQEDIKKLNSSKLKEDIEDLRNQLFAAIKQRKKFEDDFYDAASERDRYARETEYWHESYRREADWIFVELTKFNALPWYKKMFHKWDI